MPPSRCTLVLPYKTNDFYNNFLSYMQYCSLCMGPETFYNIDTPFILHFYWFHLDFKWKRFDMTLQLNVGLLPKLHQGSSIIKTDPFSNECCLTPTS